MGFEYGFRKKNSTSLASLYLHDEITSAIDERKHTVRMFLDLSKAFDAVNHRLLLTISSNIMGFVVWP